MQDLVRRPFPRFLSDNEEDETSKGHQEYPKDVDKCGLWRRVLVLWRAPGLFGQTKVVHEYSNTSSVVLTFNQENHTNTVFFILTGQK